jgi:glucose uptake protein
MLLSPSVAWVLMLLSMTCWGSWANTFKLTRGVRFELFYWDYAIGTAASAFVLAAIADLPPAGGAAFPPERSSIWRTCCWSRPFR